MFDGLIATDISEMTQATLPAIQLEWSLASSTAWHQRAFAERSYAVRLAASGQGQQQR